MLTEERGSGSQVRVYGGGIFSAREHTVMIIPLTTLSAHSLKYGAVTVCREYGCAIYLLVAQCCEPMDMSSAD